MADALLANLLKLIDTPRDGALLRYAIGNEYLKAGDPSAALVHLRAAIVGDPTHSASWKLLGKTLAATGALEEALTTWRTGIAVAEKRGDKQAMKEMAVFVRRIEKRLAADHTPPS